MSDQARTIYARASAPGRAGVAVVRISGPAVRDVLHKFNAQSALKTPRRACRVHLRHPESHDVLDDVLALYFVGPASFTGEDVAEFHLHGGMAVVKAVLDACAVLPELRVADPGEFSRRAFANGKLDLAQAEGLADLIHAETEAQRRQALKQADGALGQKLAPWRERLIGLSAHLEAVIDFPEDDLPPEVFSMLQTGFEELDTEIGDLLDDSRRGERLREGIEIALIGAPNAGKSSLLNALMQRDIAIVSDIPGTTRDVLEAHLDFGGYPVTLVDTAGQRDSEDVLEREGIRRAQSRAAAADLRLHLVDPISEKTDSTQLADSQTIVVWTKADLWPHSLQVPEGIQPISVKQRGSLDGLISTLTGRVAERFGHAEGALITRARHREALTDVRQSLKRAQDAPLPELMAEDLRQALRSMGRVTGTVAVDDILDIVFGDFCIGK